jgi:hypothetical protein
MNRSIRLAALAALWLQTLILAGSAQAAGAWTRTASCTSYLRWLQRVPFHDDASLGRDCARKRPLSSETYDPGAQTWNTVSATSDIRWQHPAVLLSDGRVLGAHYEHAS